MYADLVNNIMTSHKSGVSGTHNVGGELESAPPTRPTHYQPQTDEETRLDLRTNHKLTCFVVTLLALAFIFCGIDKTSIGYVATSSFAHDANLSPTCQTPCPFSQRRTCSSSS